MLFPVFSCRSFGSSPGGSGFPALKPGQIQIRQRGFQDRAVCRQFRKNAVKNAAGKQGAMIHCDICRLRRRIVRMIRSNCIAVCTFSVRGREIKAPHSGYEPAERLSPLYRRRRIAECAFPARPPRGLSSAPDDFRARDERSDPACNREKNCVTRRMQTGDKAQF